MYEESMIISKDKIYHPKYLKVLGVILSIEKAQQEISAENPPKHKQIIDFMKKVVYNTEKMRKEDVSFLQVESDKHDNK